MKLVAVNIDKLDMIDLEKFNDVYNALKQKDITLLIISNQQYLTLASVFKDYENIYYVSEQGVVVAYDNEVIEKNTFSEMEVVLILEDLLSLEDMVICVRGVNKAYLQSKDSAYYDVFHSNYEQLEVVDDFEKLDDQVVNFIGYVENAETYLAKCSDVMFVDSKIINEHMISFMMEDVSIDSGIVEVCRRMNISKDDIMYFEGNTIWEDIMKSL